MSRFQIPHTKWFVQTGLAYAPVCQSSARPSAATRGTASRATRASSYPDREWRALLNLFPKTINKEISVVVSTSVYISCDI